MDRNETDKRWCVSIVYSTKIGECGVDHWIDELEELAELVERGPHWQAIIKIEIRFNAPAGETITVEAAEAL